jgi:MoaA/NifB/PqqE/SkfB family radical SAM enzyme
MESGPETPPDKRKWGLRDIHRTSRGWLSPYIRSRVMPGQFHPITAYQDVARRSIDWLHDNGCRVLALMGGEPLLRPDFVHKVVYYAAKKGFWVYIATNGRLLRPDVADRLGDAGASAFNFAMDAWDLKPGLPKALIPAQKNLEYILRQQYVHAYVVFFNINICRNNLDECPPANRVCARPPRRHRLSHQ